MTTAINKSRKTFIMVVLAFILPVVIAKLALSQKWFNYGVTNKGLLLAQPMNVTELGVDKDALPEGWLIIYQVPKSCDQTCESTLYGINNAHTALGKERVRVTPVSVVTSPLTEKQLSLASSKYWSNLSAHSDKFSHKVWISDPLGNVMLSFELPKNRDAVPAFGKAMVTDLQKLLKYSKIG